LEKLWRTFIFETHITPEECDKLVRILVIEDEQKLAAALRQGLEADQYTVDVAYTGEEGFYQLHAELFDLVILDVMLPGRSGLEILETLRKRGIQTPVLILTARDTTEDRVRGLDAGADDYLVKPFAFAELLARVRALLRRGAPEGTTKLKALDLEMDVVAHVVTRSGQALDLTAREFEILEYLLRNQGGVVSREMLIRDVWKESARHAPLDNVIDVHMARLRRKVDYHSEKKLVQTVRGVGYIIRQEPE
jgi:two-component system, OmpR family, copper resistance phosphate regulon response regulator CusR